MEAWLADALAAGAVGLSTGLYFAPGLSLPMRSWWRSRPSPAAPAAC